MKLVAFVFVAVGYTILYWGASQIKRWDKSGLTTDAAPLAVLFGVSSTAPQWHNIPFPYTNNNTSGASIPSTKPSGGTTGGPTAGGTGGGPGAAISPNYPGLPGSTIPAPPVGGG